MDCVYPHCSGTLRTGRTSGFCTLCRLPARACARCGAWNRASAAFCRQCGTQGSVWGAADPVDPQALHADPRRSTVPQPVTTLPQPASGFLWAMGDQGDLYRLNPYARTGEQVDVHDRFWADAQPHTFSLRPAWAAPSPTSPFSREDTAVIATPDRITLYGLFSRQRRSFPAAPGETFLVNSRDEFQFIPAHHDSLYALSRYGGQQSFLHLHADTGDIHRLTLTSTNTPLCGP